MAHMSKKITFLEGDKNHILKNFPSMVSGSNINNPSNFNEILNTRKKITRLELHAMMLGNYVKLERIPRGQRVQKAPAMFIEDVEFCEKWVSILNKCSSDLMLLLIEKSSETISTLKSNLDNSLSFLKDKFTVDKFVAKMKETEDLISVFAAKIKDFKLRKFDRDAKDYSSNKVHKFLKRNSDGSNTVLQFPG